MTARPAAAAWVQDRFVIGAWGGGYGSPYTSLYADSCEVRRMFKAAREGHLSMLLLPTTGGEAPTLRSLRRMPSAYGIRLVARGSRPRVIPPDFLGVTTTSPEWAAFAGTSRMP